MRFLGYHSNFFPYRCQRTLLAGVLALGALLWAGPAAASQKLDLQGFKDWRISGALSINWRNVGPREPGFETQIQNELFLADIYFGFHGPVLDEVPVFLEFHMPTGDQGQIRLYRFFLECKRIEDWDFRLGKFLVPFGRYNELYRPEMFLTITRPLLYASPDSLDLVVRINSPRPPFSSGYTDIGLRTSYYPPLKLWYVPSELTFFVVNGLGESSNRSRTFPTPENLGIPAPPANGVSIDFGHENNNLADNNNNKAFGGRMVFALGDLDLPWPIPEGKRELDGVAMGLSAMGGQYNLEAELNYRVFGVDAAFEYKGVHFQAEYMYSFTHFRSPLEATPSSTTLMSPTNLVRDFEEIQGYYIQAHFPLWRDPFIGDRVTGVLVYNRLFRRGPLLDLLTNQTVSGTTYESVAAYNTDAPRIDTRITKLTAAINWQLSTHFLTKFEYSYWTMNKASTLQGIRDIYQGAISIALAF